MGLRLIVPNASVLILGSATPSPVSATFTTSIIGWRATYMRTVGRDIRHRRRQEPLIDTANGARPRLISWAAHCDRDGEIRVVRLQSGDLLAKDEIAWRPEAQDQVNLSGPPRLGQITRYAHHWRDTYAAADQHNAVRLFSGEDKGPIRRLDINFVTDS